MSKMVLQKGAPKEEEEEEEEEEEGGAEDEAGRDGRKGKVLSPEKMQAKILKRPRVKRGVVNCASALTGGRKRKEKE